MPNTILNLNIFFLTGKNETYINNKGFVPSTQGVLEWNNRNYTRVQSKDSENKRTRNN